MEKLLIKTAPTLQEFQYVETLNPNIEIQLLKSFIENPNSIESWFVYLTQQSTSEVQVLHSPLHQGDDIDWDDLLDPEILAIVKQTCALGERLAQHYQRPMPVVFHFGGNVEKIKHRPMIREAYLTIIHELLADYPNVVFFLENVVIVDDNQARGGRRYREADVRTVVDFVEWLRETFKMNHRFYSVLDTCHALMSIRLLEAIGFTVTLDDFFKAHQPTCGLIHLANCHRFGFGLDHGTPFTKKDSELLQELLDLYEDYRFDCPVTIELREDDYLDYHNYRTTLATLESLMSTE